jgi:hypothetical protein
MAAVSTMVLAAAAVGTAVQAYGQYQAGQDAKKAADYNAQIMERNKQVALEKANYEAEAEASRLRRLIGSQRAAAAASGMGRSGTILDLQEDTTIQGTMEQLAILYGGQLQAQGFQDEANMSRFQGEASARQGKTAAFGTILTGSAQTAYMGYDMGVWGSKKATRSDVTVAPLKGGK